jgi:hypothetical protein
MAVTRFIVASVVEPKSLHQLAALRNRGIFRLCIYLNHGKIQTARLNNRVASTKAAMVVHFYLEEASFVLLRGGHDNLAGKLSLYLCFNHEFPGL